MSSPTADPRGFGLRRRASRLGARQAAGQAAAVALAFALAGVGTQLMMDRVDDAAAREQVEGEVRSLREEYAQRGPGHLPHTLAKRERLWRGFAYGLAGGGPPSGMLAPAARPGWSLKAGRAEDADRARRPFLVETAALPGGERLAVGQDLSARMSRSAAFTRALWLCGGLGALLCTAVTIALAGAAWRRVAALAATARAVADGRSDLRSPERRGPAKDDLDDLAHAFNAMLDGKDRLLAQVRRVSAGIAHDLRTPLTRVTHRLERLRAHAADDPVVGAEVGRVQDDLAEILRTFDALLQLAEIEQGRAPADAVDLAEVATRVGEAFRPDIEEGGRALEVECGPAWVRADPHLLAQAVANLLDNAARHTPVGSRIAVSVRADPTPSLTVTDDGPGVPSARREDVVRPMVRLEASRSTPGSGLGLALVAAVAARCGARLSLRDARPGLRVTLDFPGGGDGKPETRLQAA